MKKKNEYLRALMKIRIEERKNKLKAEREESEDQFVLKPPVLESVTNTLTFTCDKMIKPLSPTQKINKSNSIVEKALPMSQWISPGPGYYNIAKEYEPEEIKKAYNAISFHYHRTVRNHEVEVKSILGPGSHTLPDKNCAPKISFSGRVDCPLLDEIIKKRRKLVVEVNSEPGFIDAVSSFGKSPVTKFDLLPRLIIKDSKIGPGSYNAMLPDYSNKYTMTERRSKSVVRVTPGPAKYRVEKGFQYLHPSPGRSFGMVLRKKSTDEIPGPGAYYPKVIDSIPSCKYFF